MLHASKPPPSPLYFNIKMTQHTFNWDRDEEPKGVLLRNAGCESVRRNAPASYKDSFTNVLERFANSGEEFTSEDITAVVGQPPNHPNTVGAMMQRAAKKGIIRKCGYCQSVRPKSHAAVIARWVGKANC